MYRGVNQSLTSSSQCYIKDGMIQDPMQEFNASCQKYQDTAMHHCLKVLEAWAFCMIIVQLKVIRLSP